MIKIERLKINGFEPAIRGMRNPMNSWDKSDTVVSTSRYYKDIFIGPNDLELAKKLVSAGPDHAKFRRMITVYVDIIAPLYWWKEFDTYKVGTVANSCSTMHKIHDKEFVEGDFSFEDLFLEYEDPFASSAVGTTLSALNRYRDLYLKSNDKKYWRQMIQLLPSSYNQKRTVMMNYEVLSRIYKSRKDHKLSEWREFCEWIKDHLPYSEDLIIGGSHD